MSDTAVRHEVLDTTKAFVYGTGGLGKDQPTNAAGSCTACHRGTSRAGAGDYIYP